MPLSAKVSTKHQISIPSEARRRLGIEPGDRLDVVVRDDTLVLRKRPARASERLWGLGAGKGWYEPDPDTYLRKLREEWEEDLRVREGLVHGRSGSTASARRPRRKPADLPDRAG